MAYVDVVQGEVDWLTHRCGAVTASRAADVMAKLKKGGRAQAGKDYIAELVCERLTGRAAEHYVTPAMDWGIQHEKLAKAAYEMERDCIVEPCGLFVHDRIKLCMASPDGLIGEDGLIEAKCPTTAIHIEYLTGGVVPEEYVWQMVCQMACSGRKWCDFVSFDPRLPESLQLFIRRLDRNEAQIAEMEAEAEKFIGEVEETIIKLGKAVSGARTATLSEALEENIGDA